MGSHEGNRYGVQPPDQYRSAVREVVRGRAGRRGTDEAVTGKNAQVLAADGIRKLDHPPERRARCEDVVDRRPALSAQSHLERRQFDHREVAAEGPRETLFHLLGANRGQKADPAEVDADHGNTGSEEAVEGAQHRAVPAERDREVRPAVFSGELDPLRPRHALEPRDRVDHRDRCAPRPGGGGGAAAGAGGGGRGGGPPPAPNARGAGLELRLDEYDSL